MAETRSISERMNPHREIVRRLPIYMWHLTMLVPGFLSISMAEDRMISPWAVAISIATLLVALRLLFPWRTYLLATWPILIFGVAKCLAHLFRGVDLVDLLLQLPTFSRQEVLSSLQPYSAGIFLCVAATGALLWFCYVNADTKGEKRPRVVYVLLALTIFITLTPKDVIGRAWPSDFLFASAALVDRTNRLRFNVFPDQAVEKSPRNLQVKWFARNDAAYHGQRQTMILIIGETVRSDYLRNCNGPDRIRPLHYGALVACDVTAGADSTFHSVPLLISRELPGHEQRVSEDTTFQRALSEVGFESYWLSVQSQIIGWSDARHQLYLEDIVDDGLLPHLSYALNSDSWRKIIVLHANNAHYPYCQRYDKKNAPYQVDCDRLSPAPVASELAEQKIAYSNAVDKSVGFVNQVIERSMQIPGEVFLVFTSDHGENFQDDRRALIGHELVHPTRWDIQVPLIFWANDDWIKSHSRQWNNLRDQLGRPLTHADIVPTLMSAADVAYDDPRGTHAVNLLDSKVPERFRPIQISLGVKTEWETLLKEAE